MNLDFSSIPEYELFTDLTTMDGMFGRGVIDLKIMPKHFKPEDRKEVFEQALKYYRENGFDELYEEYIMLMREKSYTNMISVDRYNNFTFNHPFIVMLYMFIEQKLLTKNLEYNSDKKLIRLGEGILPVTELKNMNISEGIIFADGTLMPIKSAEAHKIGSLWMLLNGKKIHKAIRYTTDCINPEPIFTSMSEYVKMDEGTVVITKSQASAIYNIHKLKSTKSFIDVLLNSEDLCITPTGDPSIRWSNAKALEAVLGSEVFNAQEVVKDLKLQSYTC